MKVSVAVRQKFHGFHLADQLNRLGELQNLYTSYYGNFLGKNNSIGISIPNEKIITNLLSTILSYGLQNRFDYEADIYFGNWVAANMGNEDIIITWGIQGLPIIKRAKELGIKVILERGSAHASEQYEILKEEFEKYNIKTTELDKSFSAQRMERELLEYELADIISIPSKFVERSFIKRGFDSKKLFVNNYGVDLTQFTFSPIQHKPFRIIYAGNLTLQKGVHYLIEAFSELDLLDGELWLIGKIHDEITPFLKKHTKNIIHIPAVPQAKLNEYYNQSDVFCINSIQEGLAMVQAQAMACGLPLICTKNTGGEDLIQNGKEGFVIPIKNISALKEKIFFFYKNRTICRQMGENANLKISNGLTWDDYGNRYLSFLHSSNMLNRD